MKKCSLYLFFVLLSISFLSSSCGSKNIKKDNVLSQTLVQIDSLSHDLVLYDAKINQRGRTVDIELAAIANHKNAISAREDWHVIDDKGNPFSIKEISDLSSIHKDGIHIAFLVDVSSSMASKLTGIRSILERVIMSPDTSARTYFFELSTFDKFANQNVVVSRDNPRPILEKLLQAKTGADESDLMQAITQKTSELSKIKGRKALFVLTDQETNMNKNSANLTYTADNLNAALDKIQDRDFHIFPLALTATTDKSVLQTLSARTICKSDYPVDINPLAMESDLETKLRDVCKGLPHTYQLALDIPSNVIFAGQPNTYDVQWAASNLQRPITLTYGSPNDPFMFVKGFSYWAVVFILGAILLFALFSALSLLVPHLRQTEFKKKYVVPYKKQGWATEYDTITGEPIRDGDLVVKKCKQTILLNVWEGLGQCPNFPDCMTNPHFNCSGSGAPEIATDNFFSQKGDLKKLNWLFFGAVGGFIAWIIYALYKITTPDWYTNIICRFFDSKNPQLFKDTNEVYLFSSETIIGIALGIGLSGALAYVEDKGAARKQSWSHVFTTLLAGTLVAAFSFLVGAIIQHTLFAGSSVNYVSSLVAWLLFGALFGLIFSWGSEVPVKRGVLGTVLGAFLAYILYWVIIKLLTLIDINSSTTISYSLGIIKLIGFMLLGSIIGYTLVTVVARLEDFEMEVIAPTSFSGRVVPISKWLKSGMEISIGTSSKCQVFVKWTDEAVLDEHALLSYQDQRVYIYPLDEVMVNNVLIPTKQKFALKDRDVIQLGRSSISMYLYKEMRK
jgi:FHA domain/von Willebrand factor type A domain